MHFTSELFSELVKNSAYLDPGSGSFLLQLLLAVFLGGAVAIRSQWARIKKLFNKNAAETEDEEYEEIDEE